MEPSTQADSAAQEPSQRFTVPDCERCRGPLTGRQKRFCSPVCRSAWWDEKHPRLGRPAHLPGERVIDRLVAIMADREWRTVAELTAMVGGAATALSARLREMKRPVDQGGLGYHVEEQPRTPGSRSRAFEYRLLLNPEPRG